jgi:glucose-6-phosphate isomerase
MMAVMNKDLVITDLSAAINLYQEDFSKLSNSLKAKFIELQNNLKNANQDATRLDYYKWLDFDYINKINQETKKIAENFKKQNFTNLVLMGMGGSGIDTLVLKNALYENIPVAKRKSKINVHIQNNLDSSSMLSKLEALGEDIETTLFVIVSKSGDTDEVRRNLSTTIDFWAAKTSSQHVLKKLSTNSIAITEPPREGKSNFLHNLIAEIKSKTGSQIPYLENDPNIGGRFSMFSPVGMFSAVMMGLDTDALIQGAKQAFDDFLSEDFENNTIAQLSILDIALFRKGIQNRYSMVYTDSLEALNKFRAQLKGESLNKNGIDSTVHIAGIGTVNHHSDLELLLKTNNSVILEQIYFKEPAADHINKPELECMQDLKSSSNHQSLIDNHISPLFTYLKESKAPVTQRIIAKQDEISLAYFMMQDMLNTIVQAGLQDDLGKKDKLDLAIRQWEVEKYKKSVKDKLRK